MISSGRYFSAALLLICLLLSSSLAFESNDRPKRMESYTLTNGIGRQASWNHQPTTTAHPCEYRDLMTGLHESLSELTTLDKDLRNRLEHIEHRLSQFEATNLAKAESLGEQAIDLKLHLTRIEALQQKFSQELHTLKLNEIEPVIRSARQTDVSDSQKLDAVATLLVSHAANIKQLEERLSNNITRLLTQTNTLFNRVERIRRNQAKGNRGNAVSYGSAVGESDELVVSSCNQGLTTTNGILKLNLPNHSAFYVLCDEVYDHGGWTIIQNRHYGDVNFQRDWQEYKTGFGNLAGDFFLGLDKIHALTTHTLHELAIVLEDHANMTQIARYNLFAIGNEQETYNLKLLGAYSGSAGDSFAYHAGSKFSTFDNDNDGCVECNCAAAHLGGWWYNWCDQSNLNGKYHRENFNSVPTYQGVYWHTFHGPNYSLRSVRMMIRPLATEENRR